jgi:hypothetical protein
MDNVFNRAEYAEKMAKAKAKQKIAHKNAGTKIGSARGLITQLHRVFSVNPELVPTAMLDKYMGLIEMFGKRAGVLSLAEKSEISDTANKILDSIGAEESKAIELSNIFESNDKKTNKDGSVDYAGTIAALHKDGKISDSDLELMKKYKSIIFQKEEVKAKTEEEIREETDEAISALKGSKIQESAIVSLATRDERDAARALKKLLGYSLFANENIASLSLRDIKDLLKIVDIINNGFFPSSAKLMTMIGSSPKYYIDQMFGDYKTKRIFNSIFGGLSKAYSLFKLEQKQNNEKIEKVSIKVRKSLGGDHNKFVKSKRRP